MSVPSLNNLARRPLLWLAVCFCGGVALGRGAPWWLFLLPLGGGLTGVVWCALRRSPLPGRSRFSAPGWLARFDPGLLFLGLGLLALAGGGARYLTARNNLEAGAAFLAQHKFADCKLRLLEHPEAALAYDEPGFWKASARVESLAGVAPPVDTDILVYGKGPRVQRRDDRITGRVMIYPERPTAFPGGFSYRMYLAGLGLCGRAKLLPAPGQPGGFSAVAIEHAKGFSLTRFLDGVRMASVRRTRALLPGQAGEFLVAAMFDYREGMSREVNELFRYVGIGHIIAISGLNVGMIIALAWWAAARFTADRRKLAACGILACLTYLSLSGWEPPAARAGVIGLIYLGGILCARRGDFLNSLGAAALILVLIEPHVLFALGFQLSFAAVVFISCLDRDAYEYCRDRGLHFWRRIFFQSRSPDAPLHRGFTDDPVLAVRPAAVAAEADSATGGSFATAWEGRAGAQLAQNADEGACPRPDENWRPEELPEPLQEEEVRFFSRAGLLRAARGLPAQAAGLVWLSITAWFGVWPLMAYAFHQVSISGLLVNILAIPLMTFTLGTGIVLQAVAFLPDALAHPLGWVCGLPAQAMLGVAWLGSFLPGGGVTAFPPPVWAALVYYALFALLLGRRVLPAGRVRTWIARGTAVLLAALMLYLGWQNFGPDSRTPEGVAFLSGRAGECAVVTRSDGKRYAIGSPERMGAELADYLHARRVSTLDGVSFFAPRSTTDKITAESFAANGLRVRTLRELPQRPREKGRVSIADEVRGYYSCDKTGRVEWWGLVAGREGFFCANWCWPKQYAAFAKEFAAKVGVSSQQVWRAELVRLRGKAALPARADKTLRLLSGPTGEGAIARESLGALEFLPGSAKTGIARGWDGEGWRRLDAVAGNAAASSSSAGSEADAADTD